MVECARLESVCTARYRGFESHSLRNGAGLTTCPFFYFETFVWIVNFTDYWRGAGVVERAGLENRCGRKSTQGSNPCLSAINYCFTSKNLFNKLT